MSSTNSTAEAASAAARKRPIFEIDISHAKRLRSKIPRRKRIPLLPIVGAAAFPHFLADEDEADSSSCILSGVSNGVSSKPIAAGNDEFRRVTRSYAKQQEQRRLVEIERSLKAEVSEGASEVSHVSGGNLKQKPVISESSCLESVSEAIGGEIGSSVPKVQISDRSAAPVAQPIDLDLTSDLACSERFTSLDDGEEWSSELSPLKVSEECGTELLFSSDFSDYSTSDLLDSSGEDFSDRSGCTSAVPSETFSLLIQYTQQLVRLRAPAPSVVQRGPSESFILKKFEEEEDEESYKALRGRERREVVLQDFSDDGSSAAEISEAVLRQRLPMVNWIVEYATDFELQSETLFLGVSLMDRFLSKGYFNNERNLELLGVACITLATRIEENQPYNSIRRKSFTVKSNVYHRCEVVAMEWLVMEVLKFQCFVPTIFNFLWFYLKAAKADLEVRNLTNYLAVLSLLDNETLRYWPSTVAAGLVILACLATNRDSSCHDVMETHVRSRNDDLSECIQSLEWLVSHARE